MDRGCLCVRLYRTEDWVFLSETTVLWNVGGSV